MKRICLVLALILAHGLSVPGAQSERPDLIPDWRELAVEPFPLTDAPGVANPVITYSDVTEPDAGFVADPFLFREDGRWYLFFEVYISGHGGVIALAKSDDGLHWHYDRIVLQESLQFSYPQVFKWQGNYYLLPSAYPLEAVRLYRAGPDAFPYEWTPVAELVTGRPFADATLFYREGRWWMFVANTLSSTCWLYFAEDLEDPGSWTEHPASPIVVGARSMARPGGRVVVLAGDRIFRTAQNSSLVYGEKLRIFEVSELSTQSYSEFEIEESPILYPSGSGWNAERMHHYDPWWTGTQWLSAVDGHDGALWSIGIYATEPVGTTAPEPRGGISALALSGYPNPFNPGTTLHFDLPARGLVELVILDLRGREQVRLIDGIAEPGRRALHWDGCDADGRPLPTGIYLARLRTAAGVAARKLVLIR